MFQFSTNDKQKGNTSFSNPICQNTLEGNNWEL
ncbi:hypothetical protein Palpr_2336 [Paludibacter propionicigenes WB4]|uniref:Uncharacterized protein n=1 Tax=Paludibacter propionicigenes (strain DSM 17365 / JCM 13257 / WB4) TaxID=694427 RepID=E4T6X6_PALPW|nr:hypothetical protein Palpr_2336 [Paludibacter propionicigenes WB4]